MMKVSEETAFFPNSKFNELIIYNTSEIIQIVWTYKHVSCLIERGHIVDGY